MHAGWRSMCGVIVVDAGRSRSTNLGHDAYILITSLDIVITIRFSINCPTVISLPTVCYFLREATSEICGPRVYSLSYLLWDLFLFAFILRSIIPKTQKYLAALFICIFYFAFYRDLFIQSTTNFVPSTWQFLVPLPVEGLATPHKRRVASICSLCAGTVYIVLLGSPTGSITLVS